MFYEGDLHSGIAKALQESKLVACFVTDIGEESKLWEDDFLLDELVKSSFITHTVLLRLIAGSQEAGYLAAIFPLPKTPTLVLIENGQLKEYIAAGVTKEEFLRRLIVVFQSRSNAPATTPATASSSANTSNITPPSTSHPAQGPSSSTETAGESAQVVQDLLAERKSGLESPKKEQDAKEKAKRAAEAKARKEALEAATTAGAQKSADKKYALMQKKRQQEMRDERARILKRVEDDKEERRQNEAQRKALVKEREGGEQAEPAAQSSLAPSSSKQSKECALQIRLFDGSTIRSRFPSQGSIRTDVRPWIDGQQAQDIPYTFKHVLTPLPNKNISISDEEQSLQSQGLEPSATLILVPVQGYTSAYEGAAGGGLVARGLSAGYGVVATGAGLITGVLGSLFGGGAPAQPAAAATAAAPPSTNINVRTLRDQDRREDQQFYNGNALNFEPRGDDDDKKKD